MTKISKNLFFIKNVFPLIWFGLLGSFVWTDISTGTYKKDIMFLAVPGFMAILGFALMKKLVWDLIDEVYDCGDHLLVRRGDEEERIPLSGIINVSSSVATNPPRITLRLATPGKFGNEISFSPVTTFTLNPFAKNAVAEDLIVRVDKARSSRTF